MARDTAYRRLADDLRREVLSGDYADGRRLPTEAELAAARSLSRQTVRRAMQELVNEGVVYRVAGRGTYPVSENERYMPQWGSIEDLIGASIDSTLELIEPLQLRADVEAAGRLRLTTDYVMSLTVLRLHAGAPFAYNTISVGPEIGRLLTEDSTLMTPGARTVETVLGIIDAHRPGLVEFCEQSITATPATGDVAARLGCDAGQPLLRIDRLYTTVDGAPVELAVSYCEPRRYSYRVNLRRRAR